MEGKKDGRSSNREQEISSITRALKGVAKELNVPVIALSQLSRAVESRPGGNKRPMLSDLRESGSIEQDADMVLFLYRDEYYGIYQDKNGKSTVGKAEVIIAKNRNGKCDTATVDFNGAKMRFKDWEYEDTSQRYESVKNSQFEIDVPDEQEDKDLPF
jgi:replicative DNA helicase